MSIQTLKTLLLNSMHTKLGFQFLYNVPLFKISSNVSGYFLNSIHVAIVKEFAWKSATCVSKSSIQIKPTKLLEFQHLVLSFFGICREQECVSQILYPTKSATKFFTERRIMSQNYRVSALSARTSLSRTIRSKSCFRKKTKVCGFRLCLKILKFSFRHLT
jgi:hypothetical protein